MGQIFLMWALPAGQNYDSFSNWSPVTSGIGQGTILGPILFLIYVNDIPDILFDVMVRLFADDTKLFKCITNIIDAEQLQLCLDSFYEWSITWQINITIGKCDVLHIGNKNIAYSYFLNQVLIPHHYHARDLGILFSCDLSFSAHINLLIDNVYSKLN